MLAAFLMLFFGYKLRDRDIQIMAKQTRGNSAGRRRASSSPRG
jgi:hypothetical protein